MISAHKVTDLRYFIDYAAEWLHYRSDLSPTEQARVAHWVGSGAAALDKTGAATEVDLFTFEDIALRGQIGNRSLRNIPKNHSPGLGITFSPPKSVSLLWGLNDDQDLRNVVIDAHLAAVDKAFSFLESQALVGRRGPQGRDGLIKAKAVAMNFLHLSSRNEDPQIHSHLILANCALGEDGKWSAIHNRGLFLHKSHADALYQSELQKTLTEKLGVAWTAKNEHHNAEVLGFSEEVINEFSTRRAEIEAVLAELGIEQTADRNTVIAELTRKKKEAVSELKDNYPEWIKRARACGFSGFKEILGVSDLNKTQEINLEIVLNELKKKTFFTRLDIMREVGRSGFCLSLEEIEAEVEKVLGLDELVEIADQAQIEDVLLTTKHQNKLFTTRFMLEKENSIIDYSVIGQGLRNDQFINEELEETATSLGLNNEQKEALKNVLLSENAIDIIEGAPGAGKTMMLKAVVDEWRKHKGEVVGMAVSARAAAELGFGAQTESDTIAKHLFEGKTIDENTLIIIDEASMVETLDLAEVVNKASKVGAKIILVGDYRQLGSVGAGGVYRFLCKKLKTSKLVDNNRQVANWAQKIVKDIREGRIESALNVAVNHGIVNIHDDYFDSIQSLINTWNTNFQTSPKNSVLLASKRSEVAILNHYAQEKRLERGEVGNVANIINDVEIRTGDFVVITKNDRHLGIKNGERYIIAGGTEKNLTLVALDDPTMKIKSIPKTWQNLQLGYALTIHKSQGATYGTSRKARELMLENLINRGWVGILGAESLKNEAFLVACSRSADQTHISLCKSDYFYELDDDSFIDATTKPLEKSDSDLLSNVVQNWKQISSEVSAAEAMQIEKEITLLVAKHNCDELFNSLLKAQGELALLEKIETDQDLTTKREEVSILKKAFQRRSLTAAREVVENRNFDPFWGRVLPQAVSEADLIKQAAAVVSIQNCMRITAYNRAHSQEMVASDNQTIQEEVLQIITQPFLQHHTLNDLINEDALNQIREIAKKHHVHYSSIQRVGIVFAAEEKIDAFEQIIIDAKNTGADIGLVSLKLRDAAKELLEESPRSNELILQLALLPGWNIEAIVNMRETVANLSGSPQTVDGLDINGHYITLER
jgi:conjugative relaxase-like TrwC/TraI family protein